jgi:SAM-dependent methyltransferase
MKLYLDSHPDGVVRHPYDQLYGWFEHPLGAEVAFRIGDKLLPSVTYARADLDPKSATAFIAYLSLVECYFSGALKDYRLDMHVLINGQDAHQTQLQIDEVRIERIKNVYEKRLERREFILKNWDGRRVETHDDLSAVYALPATWELEPRITKNPDLVCRHFYDGMINDFLQSAGPNAMFVEIGAGLRFMPADNVVTVEIYDYPSTDVLGVAESLPFRNCTFDGALALNILEHVKDPFLCARELRRVVKPGGKIYVMIPFLAPEHGYPSHYFNATRFGARELFSNCQVEKQIVHPSSHPIGALGNFLSVYADGLPAEVRDLFWGMPASALLALSGNRDHPIVRDLDPEAAWKIAWGTTTIFVNPGAE